MKADQTLTKRLIAAVVFAAVGFWLGQVVPSVEIAWVMAFLLLTIFLFAFEVVGVDVAAITIMVLLGLSSLLAPLMGLEQGLVPTQDLFEGFASNAVISIIAVMIIGAGLDKTGIMSTVASFILKVGGYHRAAHHPADLGHRRLHLELHAERGRGGALPAGGEPHLGAHRAAHVAPADAHGLLRHPRRHRHHGGLEPPDPAQRPAADLQQGAAAGSADGGLPPVRRDAHRRGPGRGRDPVFRGRRPFRAACQEGRASRRP